MDTIFEKIKKSHKKEVADIFNYYIINTTAAYREDAVNEDFALHFLEGPEIYRSFVIKNYVNEVIGFSVLEPFMNISTFSEGADVMYFIRPAYTGRGVGSLILKRMEDEARKIGIRRLLVDISADNEGSIAFHRKNGFVEYGKLDKIGKKFGRDFGIVYMVKELY